MFSYSVRFVGAECANLVSRRPRIITITSLADVYRILHFTNKLTANVRIGKTARRGISSRCMLVAGSRSARQIHRLPTLIYRISFFSVHFLFPPPLDVGMLA